MRQTNWKTVKRGTPVLFRRSKDLEYEEALFGGAASYGASSGAFCWFLTDVSGSLFRRLGARVDPKTGEWNVDEHYLKLAHKTETIKERTGRTPKPTKAKTVIVEVTKQVKVTYESETALRSALASLKTDKHAEVHSFTCGAGNDFSYKPKNKRIQVKVVE